MNPSIQAQREIKVPLIVYLKSHNDTMQIFTSKRLETCY
jgi:hypothetical protein